MPKSARNAWIATIITVVGIIAMIVYGNHHLQSIIWGPRLPEWSMYMLWVTTTIACVASLYFHDAVARQEE